MPSESLQSRLSSQQKSATEMTFNAESNKQALSTAIDDSTIIFNTDLVKNNGQKDGLNRKP